MTDNEIIGAMYYCRDFDSCNINCPFNNKGLDCESIISKYALDRIGRQQAEIELKTMDIESLTNERNALEEMVKEQQAEIERLSRPCFVLNYNPLSDKEMKKALKENPMTIVPVDNYTIKRIDEEGIRKENDSAHNFYKLFCQTTNTYFVNTGSECHDLGGDSDHYNVTFQKKENVAYVKKCGEDFDNRDVDATIGVEDIIKLLV